MRFVNKKSQSEGETKSMDDYNDLTAATPADLSEKVTGELAMTANASETEKQPQAASSEDNIIGTEMTEELTDSSIVQCEEEGKSQEEDSQGKPQTEDSQVGEAREGKKQRNKQLKYRVIQLVFTVSLVIFTLLLMNEIIIQPYRSKKAIEKIQELYQDDAEGMEADQITKEILEADKNTVNQAPETAATVKTSDPKRDAQGRLLYYSELLAANDEVKGWIKVPDTNIDYVVVQSGAEDPEFYLRRNLFGEDDKAGTLFIDTKSSIEDKTQNIVIHGHNMYSTGTMFHELVEYKKLDFYQERPILSFDTIYQTGKWKVFAVFITNGTDVKEPIFDYTRSEFTSTSDFLNFVYQLRIRSLFLIDDVTIKADDQLLTLSTCSYEVKDYRTVIVARKVRGDEELTVDVESVKENPNPLYPESYYYRYGGKAPKLYHTFEAALEAGEITWYEPEQKKPE